VSGARKGKSLPLVFCEATICAALLTAVAPGDENPDSFVLPSGQFVTPLAIPGAQLQNLELRRFPQLIAGGAMTSVMSPGGKTLLVLTSGYAVHSNSPQYIFLYDLSSSRPNKRQTIRIPNSFAGIAFDPNGETF
jgi:hypothetical protein